MHRPALESPTTWSPRTALVVGASLLSAALLVLAGVASTPLAALPALGVGAGAALAVRRHLALRARHGNLMALADFLSSVDREPALARRLEGLLERTREALRSDRAEIAILTDGVLTRYAVEERGRLQARSGPPERAEEVLMTAAVDGLVVRSGGHSRAGIAVPLLAARGWRDCLVVPLPAGGGVTGALVVADRAKGLPGYGPDEERLLGSVAAQVATALANGQLLERLTYASQHDALTGLANRVTFYEHLALAVGDDRPAAVLMLDLDRFKDVNDTLGHHHGDLLLREVAARLVAASPGAATVARFGGDEFAVLLPNTDAHQAHLMARAMWAAVTQPVRVDGILLDVQPSIGVAACPEHGREPAALVKGADTAMYAAKHKGAGVELYDRRRDGHSPRRLALASRIRTAAADGHLRLEYQPQIDLAGTRVIGVEALMRWHHPEFGQVSPGEFIPLAERSGAISSLSRWALVEAVAQAARWRDEGVALEVSVNLSMRNLNDGTVTELLSSLLAEHRLDPQLLTLEITESQIMDDPERTQRTLQGLANLGVSLSIDDFGTGYSSLAYLRQLPVHEIKIDRSFMAGLASGEQQAAIIRAITDLSRSLSMRVVAEGVEDLPTLQRLGTLGCDRVQGFLFSKSLPPANVAPWIAAQEPYLPSVTVATHPPRRLALVGDQEPRIAAVAAVGAVASYF